MVYDKYECAEVAVMGVQRIVIRSNISPSGVLLTDYMYWESN